jgi:hypothetical protein
MKYFAINCTLERLLALTLPTLNCPKSNSLRNQCDRKPRSRSRPRLAVVGEDCGSRCCDLADRGDRTRGRGRTVEQVRRNEAPCDICNVAAHDDNAALNDYRVSHDEATADHDREGCEGPTSDTSDHPTACHFTADHTASPDVASNNHAADNSHLSSWRSARWCPESGSSKRNEAMSDNHGHNLPIRIW